MPLTTITRSLPMHSLQLNLTINLSLPILNIKNPITQGGTKKSKRITFFILKLQHKGHEEGFVRLLFITLHLTSFTIH